MLLKAISYIVPWFQKLVRREKIEFSSGNEDAILFIEN